MLSPNPPLTGQHPDVRIDAATRDNFAKRCKKAGTTTSAGVRQLIAAYLAAPFKFHAAEKAEAREEKILGVRDTEEHVQALKVKATKAGISHGEAIRQIIRNYMGKGARS